MPLVPMTPGETSAMIDEMRKRGFDPAVTRCCIPSAGLPGSVKGIEGCNMADRCNFHLTRMGGFRNKTWRPRNVAVRIKPDPNLPHQNILCMSCHGFVQVLGSRLNDAIRDQGQYGASELIQVVAQEGEKYKQIVDVKLNEKDPNTTFTQKLIDCVVPEYKHTSQLAGTDAQRGMAEAMKDVADYSEPTGPPKDMDLDWSEFESKATADD